MDAIPHPEIPSPAQLQAMLDDALAVQALKFHAAIIDSLSRAEKPETSDAMAIRLRNNAAAMARVQRQAIQLLQQRQTAPRPAAEAAPTPPAPEPPQPELPATRPIPVTLPATRRDAGSMVNDPMFQTAIREARKAFADPAEADIWVRAFTEGAVQAEAEALALEAAD